MTILVAEDDVDLLDILCFAIRRAGHDVVAARDGAAALELFRRKEPQLVLLDVQMPRMDGWEVCKAIRDESSTPIIMLTARSADEDVVRGLQLGADDYICKPFSPTQLLARVQAVLRRTNENPTQPRLGWQTISAGDLRLDPQWRRVTRSGHDIHLTPIEFKLLYELVLHEGQVLPHQTLTDRVWGYEGVDDASLLKGHIRNMRRKLEDDSASSGYIQTVAGVGYTFRRKPESSETRALP
ncbi:MAG TPA: response regulator transcription factor [Dehalococcoidia bacterium]|nr:response regulator transcription factor [Dehalococcoidia bacterium]